MGAFKNALMTKLGWLRAFGSRDQGYQAADAMERALDETAAAAAWPVGSVFIGVTATNPNTLLGYGTWSAFGAGRTLVGLDAGQTEFDTVEETGGAKTHTLTIAEMPVHGHDLDVRGAAGTSNSPAEGSAAVTGTSTTAVQNEGGGGAHNNLQPYIVVYFWKRTA